MIEKHKNQEKKRGISALPDVGTYKPFPVNYDTFGKLQQNKLDNKLPGQHKVKRVTLYPSRPLEAKNGSKIRKNLKL
jgi:hypothetical protein